MANEVPEDRSYKPEEEDEFEVIRQWSSPDKLLSVAETRWDFLDYPCKVIHMIRYRPEDDTTAASSKRGRPPISFEAKFGKTGDETEKYKLDFIEQRGEDQHHRIGVSLDIEEDPAEKELLIYFTYPDKNQPSRGVDSHLDFSYDPETGILQEIFTIKYDKSGNQIIQKIKINNPKTVAVDDGDFLIVYDNNTGKIKALAGKAEMPGKIVPMLALEVPLQVDYDTVAKNILPLPEDDYLLEDPLAESEEIYDLLKRADLQRAFGIESIRPENVV